jgi:stage II sporulation protein D
VHRRRSDRFALLVLVLTACAAPRTGTPRPIRNDAGLSVIRVMLGQNLPATEVTATGPWMLLDNQRRLLAKSMNGEQWRIERDGRRLRAAKSGARTGWVDGVIYAVPSTDAFVLFAGRRYRGEMEFRGMPQGVLAANRVRIDDYLTGVVPLEMGGRTAAESAAVQAQAITARSYAYVHLNSEDPRGYDVTATTSDQVYGGVDAEQPLSTRAIESTRGLVLKYAGRVINAPYSAVCGGETAAQSEVWRTPDEPYLKRVSDRIPGTDRYYCDIAPRFRWTRTFDETEINAAVASYLSAFASVPGNPGRVRSVVVASRTPSNRVGALTISTDRGDFTLHGNDIRSVLRGPGGEILNSTYFSVDSSDQRDGHLTQLTLRGGGYGHGVGMCQWGAIGRSRAGQDFRAILAAYYQGTTVGPLR